MHYALGPVSLVDALNESEPQSIFRKYPSKYIIAWVHSKIKRLVVKYQKIQICSTRGEWVAPPHYFVKAATELHNGAESISESLVDIHDEFDDAEQRDTVQAAIVAIEIYLDSVVAFYAQLEKDFSDLNGVSLEVCQKRIDLYIEKLSLFEDNDMEEPYKILNNTIEEIRECCDTPVIRATAYILHALSKNGRAHILEESTEMTQSPLDTWILAGKHIHECMKDPTGLQSTA